MGSEGSEMVSSPDCRKMQAAKGCGLQPDRAPVCVHQTSITSQSVVTAYLL